MRELVKIVVKSVFRFSGFQVLRKETYDLITLHPLFDVVYRWSNSGANPELINFIFSNIHKSKSQLQQDLFALYISSIHPESRTVSQEFVTPTVRRYFVEFGAANGISHSNTYLLEKEFNWNGILCEPARTWHLELTANRSCTIDHRCVYSKSDINLIFNETIDAELSTISEFSKMDNHANERNNGNEYSVITVSLDELLRNNKAPKRIDLLSVDTEGSEFEILGAFDFSQWEIQFLAVEHNFTPQRELIHDLLVKNGFRRVLSKVSAWDDWYISNEIAANEAFPD
jgi:FkbM family methyltransferase